MMKTVQIVLDERLLRAADRSARRAKRNRSELIREALREHLRRERTSELEARHRAGYERFPEDEFIAWEKVESWPED